MRTTGFTLIELLVTVSIMALLIGLLLPVLGAARIAGRRAATLSDLRQCMTGHVMYQHDYEGHVPWGYTPITLYGEAVTVRSARSKHTFGFPVSERFPWRLEWYLSEVWDTLYSQQPPPDAPRADDPLGPASVKAYDISLFPTFALNTAYVGGHAGPLGGFVTDPQSGFNVPNVGEHVVFYDRDVDQTSELIVFTEVLARNGDDPLSTDNPDAGLHWSTPPLAGGRRWTAQGDTIGSDRPGNLQGLPISRTGPGTPTAFFDGHVEVLDTDELSDMRRWSVAAKTPDDDPIP
ncbi:MAG: prepilin-type N-terminal cleavage/methylation domain-containing protein [Planctomycetota bacterium]